MRDDLPTPTQDQRHERRFVHLLLLVLLLALVIRLAGFLVVFSGAVLQMDFAAFYTAGRSVAQGLSPYENHVASDPELWDGVGVFAHSRFLHPPLAARGFQLLAALPYSLAKLLWTLANLLALAAALVLSFRLAGLNRSMGNLLVVGIVAAAAYPTLTLLERGQIDGIVLLAIVSALTWMRGSRGSLAAGGLLALTTLFKPIVFLLLPFLLLRRRWHAAAGFVAGGLALLGLGLVVDGPATVSDYAFHQLPRISAHGEGGSVATRLPRSTLASALRGLPDGFAKLDGRSYKRRMFPFVLNASIPQSAAGKAARSRAQRWGVPLSLSGTALVLLLGFGAWIYAWQRRYGPPGGEDEPAGGLLYWQLVLTVVLLCGPVTWAMTAVWLLPLTVLILREVRRLQGTGDLLALLVCALGLLAAVVPDPYALFALSPFPRHWMDQKYVVGELLVMVGLLWLWREQSPQRVAKSVSRPHRVDPGGETGV